MTIRFVVLPLVLVVCSPSPAARVPAIGTTSLRAEVLSPMVGMHPVTSIDPMGTPAPTSLVIRVTNDGDAPVVLRTGGDDEGFDITVMGAASVKSAMSCPDVWSYGKKQAIAARDHVDLPLRVLASGPSCRHTAHYLVRPGKYELHVSVIAHVHDPEEDLASRASNGTRVVLRAPPITIEAR